MELEAGKVAVVTGAGSGIGRALVERFARSGLNIVLADVQALAATTLERFGAVHVVCNNAGVVAKSDPWFGPLSAWQWVMGVNFWGVVHGIRAFLPHLLAGGHIVNTASVAGLYPGFGPIYDASKHAVVALSDDLYVDLRTAGVPVGVSVLCPGWVRTGILDAERNWPTPLGELPDPTTMTVLIGHVRRAVDEGATPAAVADAVAEAVAADRFWVIPHQEFLDLAIDRWHSIAERLDPERAEDVPGLPPRSQIIAEVMAALESAAPQS